MKRTSAPRLPTGDGLTVPRLASARQAVALWINNTGGGCSNNLIRLRSCSGRAGMCDEGLLYLMRGVEG